MGMSIDEAENYLIALKHCETCEATDTNICKSCPNYRRGSSAKCYDAIDVAIDIMRKYQKIREIAFPLQFCTTDKLNHEAIMKICEVIGDGNVD